MFEEGNRKRPQSKESRRNQKERRQSQEYVFESKKHLRQQGIQTGEGLHRGPWSRQLWVSSFSSVMKAVGLRVPEGWREVRGELRKEKGEPTALPGSGPRP